MGKVKPYQVNSEEWDDDEIVPSKRKKKKSKKKKTKKKKRNPFRGLISFIFFVLLGCVIWQGPAIISQTGLHHKITASFLSDCPGIVRTESVQLDWQKPIVIKQVSYENQLGQSLLKIEEIRSDKNLIDFVIDFWNAGEFTIKKPVVVVQANENGTNWDHSLKKWSQPDKANTDQSAWQFPYSIVIEDGSVELHEGNDSVALISDIQASMTVPKNPDDHAIMEWTSNVGANGQLLVKMDANSNIAEEGKLEFQLNEIELAPFKEILNSLANAQQLAGLMSGKLQLDWKTVNQSLETALSTNLNIEEMNLALPDYLEDTIQLSEITLTGTAQLEDSQMIIEQLDLNSEPVQITSTGKISLDDLMNLQTKSQLMQLASQSEYSIDTNFDIANICKTLPQTVQLHDDVDIESGTIHCTLNNQSEDKNQKFIVKLNSSELVARRNSKTLRWEDPIQIEIQAHAEESQFVIDQATCDSDFLSIKTTKQDNNLNFKLQCDLDLLAEQIETIVDLSNSQLKGQLKGEIDYQTLAENRYQIAGEFSIEELQWQWKDKSPWIEENLTCNFEGNGQTNKPMNEIIESGQLSLIAGEDRLKIHTEEDPYQDDNTPLFNLVVKGDLAQWKNRVSPIYPLDQWNVTGTVDGKVKIKLDPQEIVFSDGYAYFEPLNVQGPSVNIKQKRAKIVTDGSWLISERRFITPKSKWNSDSLALSLTDFEANFNQGQIPQLDGELTFKGSFPKLLAWVDNSNTSKDFRYKGQIASQINFSNTDSLTKMNGELQLNHFAAYTMDTNKNQYGQSPSVAWKPVWKEKRIALKTNMAYDETTDHVTINQCDLSSSAVLASISGHVDQLMTSRIASLNGDFDYDFPKLLASLDPSISKNIQIIGKKRSSFSIAGPMNSRHRMAVSPRRSSSSIIKSIIKTVSHTKQNWPEEFIMNAGMGWQSAEIYGLNVGAGDVNATLQNQMIDFGAVELDVNQGMLKIHPKIDFEKSPATLSIGTGRVIQGVEITREVCQSWMKFVTPVLADSAEVDGIFSLDLAQADMPLGQMKNSEVQGTLLIHQAQAQQGPMANKMITLAKQIMTILKGKSSRTIGEFEETSIRFPKQQVPFRMHNGQVTHRNLTMFVNDVKIKTSGTVNADQSINMVAEILVAEDWVDGNKYLKSMKGKTLKIPIRGTLALPQIDQRAFSSIAQQAIQGSANEVIDNQVQKQFNKLFDKIR